MKHIVKISIGIFLFLAGLFIVWEGLRDALVEETDYYRFTFHEFYNQKNMDVLFVGSSHSWVSVNPAVMDQELSLYTFNGGRDSQTLDGSLMVIKEAAKTHLIKQVYLEMYYGVGGYTRSSRSVMEQTYLISDYLKPSVSKCLYMLNASGPEQYIYSFFPMRREWESLYDLDKIQTILKNKASDDYFKPNPNGFYVGKGFGTKQIEIKDWNCFNKTFSSINLRSYMGGDWQEDLNNIIQFCKENQIELTLYSAPISDFQLSSCGNYDDYVTMLHSLLEGTGISYWDFNLCRETYFPCDSALFYNAGHLNSKGAEIFSTLFARFIRGEIAPEELFYDSYEEKLQHLEPNVFGVTYQIKNGESATTFRSCHVISTSTENMEYRITIHPEESEPYLVRDYGQNTDFPLNEDGAGKIIIRWRVKGKPESTGERIIDFPKES